MSLTTNGKTATKTRDFCTSTRPPIVLRRAQIWEAGRIGEIASLTYLDSPLTIYLSPYREKYFSDYLRGFTYRAIGRMLDPRNLTFVACEANNLSHAIGYAQFIRFGDDEGARKQMDSRKSLWMLVLSWIFWAYCKVFNYFVKDRSADPEAVADFERGYPLMYEKHWNSHPDRKSRWHAQSVVISEEYQGRGIGKKLLAEVINRAESEGVCVGLEASPPGEYLYRSLGFKMISRFDNALADDHGRGGVMMWIPSTWKTEEINLPPFVEGLDN